jgi:hypothetical protein
VRRYRELEAGEEYPDFETWDRIRNRTGAAGILRRVLINDHADRDPNRRIDRRFLLSVEREGFVERRAQVGERDVLGAPRLRRARRQGQHRI